jgi:hypothetical protein
VRAVLVLPAAGWSIIEVLRRECGKQGVDSRTMFGAAVQCGIQLRNPGGPSLVRIDMGLRAVVAGVRCENDYMAE